MSYYDLLMDYSSSLTVDEMREVVLNNSIFSDMKSYYDLIKKKNNLADDCLSMNRADFDFELKRIAVEEVKVLDEIRLRLEAREYVNMHKHFSYAMISEMKDGDLKVNGKELRMLLCIACDYFYKAEPEEELSKDVKKDIQSFLSYMEDKYLRLSDVRIEEKRRFELMKKLQDEKTVKELVSKSGLAAPEAQDIISSMQRDSWGNYLEIKTKREELQKRLKDLKEKSGWDNLEQMYKISL